MNVEAASAESLYHEFLPPTTDDGAGLLSSHYIINYGTLQSRRTMFKNRFWNLVQLGSVLNNAAESFFKSKIWQRLL